MPAAAQIGPPPRRRAPRRAPIRMPCSPRRRCLRPPRLEVSSMVHWRRARRLKAPARDRRRPNLRRRSPPAAARCRRCRRPRRAPFRRPLSARSAHHPNHRSSPPPLTTTPAASPDPWQSLAATSAAARARASPPTRLSQPRRRTSTLDRRGGAPRSTVDGRRSPTSSPSVVDLAVAVDHPAGRRCLASIPDEHLGVLVVGGGVGRRPRGGHVVTAPISAAARLLSSFSRLSLAGVFAMLRAWPGPCRSGLGTQRVGSHHDPFPVG